MARPSPEERKRRDARRQANAKLRVTEQQIQQRVHGLIDEALTRSRGRQALPDLPELLERLEEARRLAMATSQPMAATAAVMAQAKLLGLDINRVAAVVGSPEEFGRLHGDVDVQEEAVLDRLRERGIGSRHIERFKAFIRDLRNLDGDDDDIIDGEAHDVEG